jgi:hypothetical protein
MPRLPTGPWASLVALAGACACASSPGDHADGGPIDAAADESLDQAADLVERRRDLSFFIPDAAPFPDWGPPASAQPLPADVKAPVRFLGPEDRLAGEGTTACSVPVGGVADRWCVFHRTGGALAELWVINVTKALAGSVPLCDGSSADCVRLTTTLWTRSPLGGPGHPFSHQFNGDVLIYYADASSEGDQLHRGPVRAWRPGWTESRVLTSADGLACYGQGRLPLVYCLDAVMGDPMKPDSFELRAGSLAQPPAAPLPSVGRFRPLRTDGAVAWQVAFSPDGAFFAVSSPDPDPAVETLRVMPTSALGTQAPWREVIDDVTYWSIGHDSQRIYFLRGKEQREQELRAADFPAGTAEVLVDGRVKDYLLPGQPPRDQGVVFLSATVADRGAFRFVPDSRTPANVVTIFNYRDVLEGLFLSADLRYTTWLDAAFRARVVRTSDRASCTLNTHVELSAFQVVSLDSGELVFWSEDAPGGLSGRNAFFARPDCTGTTRFGADVGSYWPVGDRALLYTDESDLAQRMTLKYARVEKDGDRWTLAAPVRVHEQVDEGAFTLFTGDSTLVLYRTSGAGGGTWAFAPPF